jgi:DNA topoisomerase-2
MPATQPQKYQKLEQREHVLKRPNMYIGSIEKDTYTTWVYSTNDKNMQKNELVYTPGLYKIFDEILVNAIDHAVRMKMRKEKGETDIHLVKNIKISINKDTGYIEVCNDGNGVEVELHEEQKIYIPELIFGHLLTSSNYDDKEEKVIGGQNGLGGKVCNVFSKHFYVETVDHHNKKIYKQNFRDNMSITEKPEIKACSKKPYTLFRFLPDYERFGMKTLDDAMYSMMVKRVYDVCAVTDNDINVFFNGEKLDYKNFEKYVNLYLGDKIDTPRIYEKIDDRWEVAVAMSKTGAFEQMSFVNGIWTIRGGKHVEYITNQIVKKLTDIVGKKKKDATIRPQYIKDNMFIFVKSVIVNPAFDGQTKETLTTPYSKFGSKPEVSDKFIDKVYKSGIVEEAMRIGDALDTKNVKKTDGKKRSIIKGIPKLDDANWAGTAKSKECTLILTEGDSAKTMVVAGLSEVGRDKYGVFPLKGKLMNVKDTSIKKIADNDEISNLKKILGLETNKTYTTVDDLRYGKIMLMTDADDDGHHIKSLAFNLFQTLWPSLFKMDNFLTSMLTPIVKVTHNRTKNNMSFYCLSDYENWKKEQDEQGKISEWKIKYYKGLGTSTNDEAVQYFKDLRIVTYKYNDKSDMSLDLAFNKSKADARKEWLSKYDRQVVLDYKQKEVYFDEFIDKELIHFSNYDVERSIPSMVDGLKISQRKIMFSCFKRNLTENEIRVAQLAAYVSEVSCYHHGEASLQAAIIAMAQNFVGSNNINLLRPNGQFGSRVIGGKDSGAPRYIYTLLEKITSTIFNKKDNSVLTYLNDDGIYVEPLYYVPIIPMILVNGSVGIGTGFSTNIPCYNPKDIVRIIKKILDGESVEEDELVPWYSGFKGKIEKINGKYTSRGIYKKLTNTKLEITELPVGVWTEDYKDLLENMLDKDLKQYENHYTDRDVRFVLHFNDASTLDKLLTPDESKCGLCKLDQDYKLSSTRNLSTNNMYLYNAKGQIQKYSSPIEIIKEFCDVRVDYYGKRKKDMLKSLREDEDLLLNKIRFIKAVISSEIKVSTLTKQQLIERLEDDEYKKHNETFDYILRIPIYNLTKDKVQELEKEYNDLQSEINTIEATTEMMMWKHELSIFEKEYEKFIEVPSTPNKTNKSKKTIKP